MDVELDMKHDSEEDKRKTSGEHKEKKNKKKKNERVEEEAAKKEEEKKKKEDPAYIVVVNNTAESLVVYSDDVKNTYEFTSNTHKAVELSAGPLSGGLSLATDKTKTPIEQTVKGMQMIAAPYML